MNFPGELVTVGCAELYLILARSKEITVAFKQKRQRTELEQKLIERGLLRALLLEFLLFVPTSSILLLIIVPTLLPRVFVKLQQASTTFQLGVYGVLGVISYGFPFAMVRGVITRIAYETLLKFAEIMHKEAAEEMASQPKAADILPKVAEREESIAVRKRQGE